MASQPIKIKLKSSERYWESVNHFILLVRK